MVDGDGLQLFVTSVQRQLHRASAGYSVDVFVRWHYTGDSSSTPSIDDVYLIASDHLVVSNANDPLATGKCTYYALPEMATGANFGPRAVCFVLGVSPSGPLTLRWKYDIFSSPEDLILS